MNHAHLYSPATEHHRTEGAFLLLPHYIHQDNLVSRHQKGKTFWNLLEQEMMGWQWHQLDQMQIICTLLQTDNHTSTSSLSIKAVKAVRMHSQ